MKKILITGSSKGIGFYIAKKLSENSENRIILNARKINDLKKAFKKIPNSIYFKADVTKINDLKKLEKKIKNIDILICNVGNGNSAIPGKEKFEDWQKSLNENFLSAVNTIKIMENKLIKSKGMIICISSICGLEYIKGAPLTYSVSKSALNAFVKFYSKILGPKGVRINAVAPGNILFKGSTWDNKLKKNKKNVQRILKDDVSLRKLGKPDDISGIVEYIINNDARFINGSIFVIDGGQIKNL